MRPKRGGVGRAILSAIGIVILGNLCMLTVAILTGSWEFYKSGWQMQIFLVSWGLCLIMYVTSSIWMLIPIGPVIGAGVILAYCQLTGNWHHLSFLWLFEAWVAIGSIMVPILLARQKRLGRGLSRLIALLLSIVSIALIIIVGLFVGVDRLIVDLGRIIMP